MINVRSLAQRVLMEWNGAGMVEGSRNSDDVGVWRELDLFDSWDIGSVLLIALLSWSTHLYCKDHPDREKFENFTFFAYAVVELIFLCFRRLRHLPRAFWCWRPLLKPAVHAARQKIIKVRLRAIIQSTADELKSLTTGTFRLEDSPYIPHFSNEALKIVWNRVVLVMPNVRKDALRFYLNAQGEPNAYYHALKQTAKAIAERREGKEDPKAISPAHAWEAARIFYLGDGEDVTESVKRFIERHIDDGIEVRCIERWPESHDFFGRNYDFGYYETKEKEAFVITVDHSADSRSAAAIVHTDPDEVDKYRKYADQLCSIECSKTWQEFWPTMLQVMNPHWGVFNSTHPKPLKPPHQLSMDDAESLLDSCVRGIDAGDREAFSIAGRSVLVLGFTAALVEQFRKAGCSIHCLDQSNSHPTLLGTNQHDLEPAGNWLNHQFSAGEKFDIVACDEAINNLRPIQYSIFLEQVRKWLKPNGMFVGRVMGRRRSRETEMYGNLTYQLAIKRLRELETQGVNSPEDFACEIIPLLHSRVAFDDNTEIIDTSKWNKLIEDDRSLSRRERDWWTFPMPLKLSSPLFDSLVTAFEAAGFKDVRVDHVIGNYVNQFNECSVGEFYRLFSAQSLT